MGLENMISTISSWYARRYAPPLEYEECCIKKRNEMRCLVYGKLRKTMQEAFSAISVNEMINKCQVVSTLPFSNSSLLLLSNSFGTSYARIATWESYHYNTS